MNIDAEQDRRLQIIHLAKNILGSGATISQVLQAAKQIQLFVMSKPPTEWDALLNETTKGDTP